MKNNRLTRIIALLLALLIVGSMVCVAIYAEGAAEVSYYVCFSSQNYSIRNANKMTLSGTEYILADVEVGAGVDFFVTDNRGTKYYAKDGDEMSTGETGTYSYTIKFSPSAVYDEEKDGFARTECHLTWGFYVPGEAVISINGADTNMKYNSYFTAYDLYCISSIELGAGATVAYGSESHTVSDAGAYRILFTPGATEDEDTYLFNADGEYGTGEDYKYRLYIEDAPQYYVSFAMDVVSGAPDTVINGENAYLLTRDESAVGAATYEGARFFASESDFILKYRIYEKTPVGTYTLIDDDNDEDTTFSKLNISDVGNYTISLVDGGDSFAVLGERVEYEHGGWYLLGSMNGWGFTAEGEVDLDEQFKFTLIEEGDEQYDEDYDQYRLTVYVGEEWLRGEDYSFVITDGKDTYRNLSQYIAIDKAGEYEILFSDEHDYGRGRNYRYSLLDPEAQSREITITSVDEYLDFARSCNSSAEYSEGLIVYLAADLDFDGREIIPIISFSGSFRGGYHKLDGFKFASDATHHSVFVRLTRDAVVERLKVTMDVSSKDSDYVGFVGKNYGSIHGVTVEGELEGKNYVGGVVAYNGRGAETTGAAESAYVNGSVTDCISYVKVVGYSNVGGVAGFNNGDMRGCVSRGSVSGKTYFTGATPINLGGVAGYSAGRIIECENYAPVSSATSSLNVGGIAGQMTGDVYYSFNYANIEGTKYVGGIVGYYGTLTEDEEDLSDYFGGMSYEELLEYINDDDGDYEQVDGRTHAMFYVANEGKVSAIAYVGGVLGYTEESLPVSMPVNIGAVSAKGGGYAGGIVGFTSAASIYGAISTGNVSAKSATGANYVGGIAGYGYVVRGSMSSAQISGDDYVGGISGYQVSVMRGNYSASIVVVPNGKEFVGDIAGYAESFNEGVGGFGGVVSDNYYTGPLGGIGRLEYGSSADNAARSIKAESLACEGVLSPLLSMGFASEGWVAGESAASYPQPRYMSEVIECSYYSDEDEFGEIFDEWKERLAEYKDKHTRVSFLVTFLEWDKDKGELYDDKGKIDYSVYEIIHTERVYLGDATRLGLPKLVYAEEDGGAWVLKATDAEYFVSFALPVGIIDRNMTIYADYQEIATTVATEDKSVLVEGRFVSGTEVKLVSTPRGFLLRFYLGGEEIAAPEQLVVKFMTELSPENYIVRITGNDGVSTEIESRPSGKYIRFSLCASDAFSVIMRDAVDYTVWYVIASLLGGAAVASAVFSVVLVIRHRRRRRGA